MILATVWLGTLLLDRRVALAGGWILATTFGFMIFSRVAMSDMLLALWSTLAFALAVALFHIPAPALALPALGAVFGLGFLTKGPVAVLLPGLGMLLLAWRRPRPATPRRAVVLAAALFALPGSRLVRRRLATARAGAPRALLPPREPQRFTGRDVRRWGRSAFFYLGTLLERGRALGPLPARGVPDDAEIAGGWATGENAGVRLLLGWIGLMLVPARASTRGKIDYYILPLYPAASLVVADYLIGRPWGAFDRGWARGVLVAGATALAFVPRIAIAVPAPVAAGNGARCGARTRGRWPRRRGGQGTRPGRRRPTAAPIKVVCDDERGGADQGQDVVVDLAPRQARSGTSVRPSSQSGPGVSLLLPSRRRSKHRQERRGQEEGPGPALAQV